MHLKRKVRQLNAVSALGTIWCDSSKLGCRNTRDWLLMVPIREPSVLVKVCQFSWTGRLMCHETELGLPHLKVFQLSSEYRGLWGLSNCTLPTGWLPCWSCHILKECRDFILLLYADSDLVYIKPVGVEAMIRCNNFKESLINLWSHANSSSPFSH